MSEPTLDNIARSFERHLRAGNKSPKTVTTYMEAVRQLPGHLGESGRSLADARRSDIETFITGLLERHSAATASNRYRALLPGPEGLRLDGGRGRSHGQPHAAHEAAGRPGKARRCADRGAPPAAPGRLRGPGLQ